MSIFNGVDAIQNVFSNIKLQKSKKELGQFFTDTKVAEYMSSLIDLDKIQSDEISILDCGAGYGALTVSTVLYCMKNGRKKISATLYEIDPDVIPDLTKVMNKLSVYLENNDGYFKYKIINGNFVTDRPDKDDSFKFDISVINPPYFKYKVTESCYAKKVSDLFKGDPNIYASFIAIMVASLKENGQSVVISPRSFLNGLYFKWFRKYLLDETNLKQIHVFRSRKDVFGASGVLQENIIFKIVKSKFQDKNITITSSNSITDIKQKLENLYPENIIIDRTNNESIIRVPETDEDYKILSIANKFPSTFTEEGYRISTGRVVDFRTTEYILKTQNLFSCINKNEKSVPLIKLHNFKLNSVNWSGANDKDLMFVLKTGYEKHINKNQNYVLLKRFSSKDEKRRLVAGFYSPQKDKYGLIGIVNKINYLGRENEEIQRIEGIGLAATLNSSFMDKYYRCISGSTQVNATDVRVMKFPSRDVIIKIGQELSNIDKITYKNIDKIFNKIIRIA